MDIFRNLSLDSFRKFYKKFYLEVSIQKLILFFFKIILTEIQIIFQEYKKGISKKKSSRDSFWDFSEKSSKNHSKDFLRKSIESLMNSYEIFWRFIQKERAKKWRTFLKILHWIPVEIVEWIALENPPSTSFRKWYMQEFLRSFSWYSPRIFFRFFYGIHLDISQEFIQQYSGILQEIDWISYIIFPRDS